MHKEIFVDPGSGKEADRIRMSQFVFSGSLLVRTQALLGDSECVPSPEMNSILQVCHLQLYPSNQFILACIS